MGEIEKDIIINRSQLLGGISSSFLVGTAGGALAGAIGGAALAYDHRSRSVNESYAQQGEDLYRPPVICARR